MKLFILTILVFTLFITPAPVSAQTQNNNKLLIDLLKVLLDFDTGTIPPDATDAGQTGQQNTAGGSQNATSGNTTLNTIIDEAGNRVGTPPRMLQTIMSQECNRLFGAGASDIQAWSRPGGGLPATHFCYRNPWGFQGPMQFSTNSWKPYANAVNRFGGYTHTPKIQNIRDSLYVAAALLKLDVRAQGVNSWSCRQIAQATICFRSGCYKNKPNKTLNSSELKYVNNVLSAMSCSRMSSGSDQIYK